MMSGRLKNLCPCESGETFEKCCVPKGKFPSDVQVKRSDIWHLRYYHRRYLKYLTKEELILRGRDIFFNMTTLNDELKISLHPILERGRFWMRRWSDLWDEFDLRGYKFPEPLPFGFGREEIPKYDWPGLPKAIEKIRAMNLVDGSFLIKYGKYEYLKDTLEKGLVRIMPASSYDDPSLNSAIKDSELRISFSGIPWLPEVPAFNKATKEIITVSTEDIDFNLKLDTNYYVYCLGGYSPRMFGDFDADSCLVVKNPQRFLQKLKEQFNFQIPEFRCSESPTHYFDPLDITPDVPEICFAKHFRFSYQSEYRIVWFPPEPTDRLNAVFLELGNLDQCCELVKL